MASKPDPIKDQWLQVTDFTAGCINYAETSSPAAHRLNPAPPGAADPTETYSCVALPTGGLGALPELSASYGWGGLSSGAHTAYLVGFLIHDDLTNGDTEAFVISEFDNGTNHYWQAYSFVVETSTWNFIINTTEATGAGIFGSPFPSFTRVNETTVGTSGSPLTLTATDYTITGTWPATAVPGAGVGIYEIISGNPNIAAGTQVVSVVGTTLTMDNPIDGTSGTAIIAISSEDTAGQPCIAFVNGGVASATNDSTGQVFLYPDPSQPTVLTAQQLIYPIGGGGFSSIAGQVLCHQNRILVLAGTNYGWPVGSGFNTNENINFTDPPNSAFYGDQMTVLQAEDPYGYGAWSSVSAGELFLVKKRGGGAVMTGDIFSPNVTFYPGIQSTGGMYGRADAGSLGVFYCSLDNGAWLWNGGNTAQKISMQLDDNFYVPAEFTSDAIDYGYFVQCIGDKAFFSNNWMYDMTLHSWWIYYPQSSQGGTNLFWVNPVSGRYFYAANLSFTGTNDFMYQFDMQTPAQTYQWQSLPLRLASPNHVNDVRQLYVRAACTAADCSVTASIYDQGNLVWGPATEAIPVNSGGYIIRFNTGTAVGVFEPQVRLKFSNSTSADMAILHEWGINYDTRAPVPESN